MQSSTAPHGQEDRMPLSHWLPGQARRPRAPCLHGVLWALFAVGLWGCGADAPRFAARTQAMHTVELRARVAGFLEQVRFQEGALVQAGQLLFVIERRP